MALPIDPVEPNSQPERLGDWSKTLEWIEKQAQENLKSKFSTADILAKEAQTTLTVMLAGVGASAAYASKLFEPTKVGPLEIGSAVTCFYLICLCVLHVNLCMKFKNFPALAQEPKNLLQSNYSFDELREAELENIHKRILEATEINKKRSEMLNGFRVATALSPIVFLLVALPFSYFQVAQLAKAFTCVVQPSSIANSVSTVRCIEAK